MKAAQEMGRKRWEGVTAEERAEQMKIAGHARQAALTQEERKELARNAAKVRWAKKRATKKGKPRA